MVSRPGSSQSIRGCLRAIGMAHAGIALELRGDTCGQHRAVRGCHRLILADLPTLTVGKGWKYIETASLHTYVEGVPKDPFRTWVKRWTWITQGGQWISPLGRQFGVNNWAVGLIGLEHSNPCPFQLPVDDIPYTLFFSDCRKKSKLGGVARILVRSKLSIKLFLIFCAVTPLC